MIPIGPLELHYLIMLMVKKDIIAPFGIKVGDEVISSLKNAPLKLGNTMPLKQNCRASRTNY